MSGVSSASLARLVGIALAVLGGALTLANRDLPLVRNSLVYARASEHVIEHGYDPRPVVADSRLSYDKPILYPWFSSPLVRAIGSVSLFADSIDFLEDASINFAGPPLGVARLDRGPRYRGHERRCGQGGLRRGAGGTPHDPGLIAIDRDPEAPRRSTRRPTGFPRVSTALESLQGLSPERQGPRGLEVARLRPGRGKKGPLAQDPADSADEGGSCALRGR